MEAGISLLFLEARKCDFINKKWNVLKNWIWIEIWAKQVMAAIRTGLGWNSPRISWRWHRIPVVENELSTRCMPAPVVMVFSKPPSTRHYMLLSCKISCGDIRSNPLRDNVFPFQTTCHSLEYHFFVQRLYMRRYMNMDAPQAKNHTL